MRGAQCFPHENLASLSQVGGLLRLLFMDELKDAPDVVWAGLLASLDQLPADARIAFLLSEVFDMRVEDVAALIGSDAARCRELIEHARTRIQSVRHEHKERGGNL
jgi:DNA-directed RNA polymerase specialized sigma24 family protein